MRPSHRRTAAALTTALLIVTVFAVSAEIRDGPVPVADLAAPVSGSTESARPEPFGATCRTRIEGSRATASCHNPYPETDRVRLHVECERWWDIDADSAPVEIAAARYAELAERCWMEIQQVWVTHERVVS